MPCRDLEAGSGCLLSRLVSQTPFGSLAQDSLEVFLIKKKEIQDWSTCHNSEEGGSRQWNQTGGRVCRCFPSASDSVRACVSSFMWRRLLSSHMFAASSPLRGTFVSKMEMVEPFQYSQFLWVFSRVLGWQKQVALLKDG